jgi:hypothetical protein
MIKAIDTELNATTMEKPLCVPVNSEQRGKQIVKMCK